MKRAGKKSCEFAGGERNGRTSGGSRAEVPLRASARCAVPAEPAGELGDPPSTCTQLSRARDKEKGECWLEFEWFCGAAAFIPLYCSFSADICEAPEEGSEWKHLVLEAVLLRENGQNNRAEG